MKFQTFGFLVASVLGSAAAGQEGGLRSLNSCGKNGQPPCPSTGCSGSRMLWTHGETQICCEAYLNYNVDNGVCENCGDHNQKPCVYYDDNRLGCHDKRTISPFGAARPTNAQEVKDTETTCVPCGGNNQPTCVTAVGPSSGAGSCTGSRKGWATSSGYTCCEAYFNYDASSKTCINCGDQNQAPCLNTDGVRFGCHDKRTITPPIVGLLSPATGACSAESWLTVLSTVAKCTACGGNGQPACMTLVDDAPSFSCTGSRAFWQLEYGGVCCEAYLNYNINTGKCENCGDVDQKPCANYDGQRLGCHDKRTISPVGAVTPTNAQQVRDTDATCVACGGNGQPSCVFAAGVSSGSPCTGSRLPWEATEGLVCCEAYYNYDIESGKCVNCGDSDQKPCANYDSQRLGCHDKRTISPVGASRPTSTQEVKDTDATCVPCGGNGQPSCVFAASVSSSSPCTGSRLPWEAAEGLVCCEAYYNYDIDSGECVNCGDTNQKPCANYDATRFGCHSKRTISPIGASRPTSSQEVKDTDATCVPCGGSGQPDCATTILDGSS